MICHMSSKTRKAGDRHQALDGLLSYAVASEITDGKPYRLQGLPAVAMPLPILTIEGLPICSVLMLTAGSHSNGSHSDIDWALRRPRDGTQTALVRGKLAKVDERGGPDQPRRVPIPVHLGLRYEALCIGNRDAITQLLAGITHIGPRADIGYGEVERWEVLPCNATIVDVLTATDTDSGGGADSRERVLSRPVPVHLGGLLAEHGITADPQDAGFGGWRPPYWHHDGYAERWSYQTPVMVNPATVATNGEDVLC